MLAKNIFFPSGSSVGLLHYRVSDKSTLVQVYYYSHGEGNGAVEMQAPSVGSRVQGNTMQYSGGAVQCWCIAVQCNELQFSGGALPVKCSCCALQCTVVQCSMVAKKCSGSTVQFDDVQCSAARCKAVKCSVVQV